MEKITSCLRERAMPSRPMDSASSMMASAGLRLSSVRFIGCGSLLCFSVPAGMRAGMGVDMCLICLDVGLDECSELRLGHGADLLGLHRAAFEDHERRDAADAVLLGDLLVLVDVDLGYLELARVVPGDLVQDRGDHLAGAAPLGPVIYQHGDIGVQHVGLETGVAGIDDLVAHG